MNSDNLRIVFFKALNIALLNVPVFIKNNVNTNYSVHATCVKSAI